MFTYQLAKARQNELLQEAAQDRLARKVMRAKRVRVSLPDSHSGVINRGRFRIENAPFSHSDLHADLPRLPAFSFNWISERFSFDCNSFTSYLFGVGLYAYKRGGK